MPSLSFHKTRRVAFLFLSNLILILSLYNNIPWRSLPRIRLSSHRPLDSSQATSNTLKLCMTSTTRAQYTDGRDNKVYNENEEDRRPREDADIKNSGHDENESDNGGDQSDNLQSQIAPRNPELVQVIEAYRKEISSLRGTPELVDRLENLASKYPGIEMELDLYRALYPFRLDDFQEEGLSSLMYGSNVLVTTPTGSGKTLVGELAIYFALMMGLRVAYTTPLKALSNQKFQDFTRLFGGDRVGLLTGDIAINRGAQITVMTTEVFRNMIYDQGSENQLSNLFMVCFDEFHFMNDPDRGTVWEESVISCPKSVRILALSATMGNVADIKGWISSIHGPTTLVQSSYRPVPLRYLFAMKQGFLPLFRDPNAGPGARSGVVKENGRLGPGANVNPSILKLEEQALRVAQQKISRSGRPFKTPKISPQNMIPKYSDIVAELNSMKLLPAIVFIFSRVGCETSAKMIMQESKSRLKLLSDEEVSYVTSAINAFARANPDIPLDKATVQMLRAGVGVHHAGLIPVLKAFVEDLFNANKIKVLFATETLAAGVNMPARSTVVSTVTKRINSEVVKLKTSQLLQMAGRAGRRGKDVEGTVVIMRNRFEDVKIGHKILTSPVDGIRSHFKTSYSLTVKLLETKSIEDCRALIERGFGAYLMQKRINKKEKNEKVEVETYRRILQKYTLKGARDYLKLARRYEKELRNGEYLVEKMIETDSDLVQAIADYMPLGIGLQLLNDESGFFLGDVKWGDRNQKNGYGVMTKTGRLLVVRKEHIRAFAEAEFSIPSKDAQHMLELISQTSQWEEAPISGSKKPLLVGSYTAKQLESMGKNMITAMEAVQNAKPFPVQELPGSVVRQKMIVKELEEELAASPITQEGEGELVLQALRYAASLKDPIGFVNAPVNGAGDGLGGGNGEVYAWRMFQNVVKILQQFNALDGLKSTDLGQMVGSFSADNELWLAKILCLESVSRLNAGELAAVMCAAVMDSHKAQSAFFKNKPSDAVQTVFDELEELKWELSSAQADAAIDFPIHLSKEAGGLVESWVNGTSWRDLCRETSLDQGDLCRILRRTVEVLRQIPVAYGVPEGLSITAYEAAKKMDRFPVADFDSEAAIKARVDGSQVRTGAGVGFGGLGGGAAGSDSDSESDVEIDFVESILYGSDEDDEDMDDDGDDNDNDNDEQLDEQVEEDLDDDGNIFFNVDKQIDLMNKNTRGKKAGFGKGGVGDDAKNWKKTTTFKEDFGFDFDGSGDPFFTDMNDIDGLNIEELIGGLGSENGGDEDDGKNDETGDESEVGGGR